MSAAWLAFLYCFLTLELAGVAIGCIIAGLWLPAAVFALGAAGAAVVTVLFDRKAAR